MKEFTSLNFNPSDESNPRKVTYKLEEYVSDAFKQASKYLTNSLSEASNSGKICGDDLQYIITHQPWWLTAKVLNDNKFL